MTKKITPQVHASKLRAIDLYSGIGGWSLGMAMAGVDVVASYEWWDKANLTNQENNRHSAVQIDIRTLRLSDLPKDIDIVVGSPPCTQFSFANRGGQGDIDDGLKDIAKFLEVVDFLRPKFWAMENVPRVAGIVEKEMQPGGRLSKYAHLNPTIRVVDTCEWGVPQRRQRCIAGNIDFELLYSYREHTTQHTLGDVVRSLAKAVVVDPLYDVQVDAGAMQDHAIEAYLNDEEERMNREMKTFHPVYNNMAFPDPLNRTARTVTATCTRVSRESIVIASPEHRGKFRRLSVRERGCLQSFPITYQFFGNSHSQKLKMIGNAIPPLFTFYLAQAILNTPAEKLVSPAKGIQRFRPTATVPPKTKPDLPGGSYARTRRFRAAIPSLRFKSGVRFELSNDFSAEKVEWQVKFFFGNSKNIVSMDLDARLLTVLKRTKSLNEIIEVARSLLQEFESKVATTNAVNMQAKWAHEDVASIHPYELVDAIGGAAAKLQSKLEGDLPGVASKTLLRLIEAEGQGHGLTKVLKHAEPILAGLIVSSLANSVLASKTFNGSRK